MIQVFRETADLILSFEDNAHSKSYDQFFLPKAKVKDYDVMIDGQNLFNQLANKDLRTYDNLNLYQPEQKTFFFILQEVEETILDFPNRTTIVL